MVAPNQSQTMCHNKWMGENILKKMVWLTLIMIMSSKIGYSVIAADVQCANLLRWWQICKVRIGWINISTTIEIAIS